MMIIAQLASDDVLDRAYEWLCRRRRDYSANSDIWNFRRGWLLENEKPPRFAWQAGAPSLIAMTTQDGIQVWRNPKMAPVNA